MPCRLLGAKPLSQPMMVYCQYPKEQTLVKIHSKLIHFHSIKCIWKCLRYFGDVIMDAIASQITSLTIVYSIVYSDADQIKHQSSASLAFVRGIHRGPVNSPHKWPVTRKMFPFDDVIMKWRAFCLSSDTQKFICYIEGRNSASGHAHHQLY